MLAMPCDVDPHLARQTDANTHSLLRRYCTTQHHTGQGTPIDTSPGSCHVFFSKRQTRTFVPPLFRSKVEARVETIIISLFVFNTRMN